MISMTVDLLLLLPLIIFLILWVIIKFAKVIINEDNYDYSMFPEPPPVWESKVICSDEESYSKFERLPYGAYGIDIVRKRKK